MNFKKTIRDEFLEHSDKMKIVITAVIVISSDISMMRLNQSMQDLMNSIHINDIMNASTLSEQNDELRDRIVIFLIFNFIQKIHSQIIDFIFSERVDSLSHMSTVNVLSTRKTQYQQLETIMKNEETLSEIMRVHDKIFLKQLSFFRDDNDVFSRRLFSVYEDVLTIKLIRSVKLEQLDFTQIFERREWIHIISSWFHIQINLLNIIIRTYFELTIVFENASHCIKTNIRC